MLDVRHPQAGLGGATRRERYEYDAYGKPTMWLGDYDMLNQEISPYGNPYYFTGRRVDEIDNGAWLIQYNRNRFYDYNTGCWFNQDPIGYQDGVNLYAYVNSNPINRADPQGLRTYLHDAPYPGYTDGEENIDKTKVCCIVKEVQTDEYTLVEGALPTTTITMHYNTIDRNGKGPMDACESAFSGEDIRVVKATIGACCTCEMYLYGHKTDIYPSWYWSVPFLRQLIHGGLWIECTNGKIYSIDFDPEGGNDSWTTPLRIWPMERNDAKAGDYKNFYTKYLGKASCEAVEVGYSRANEKEHDLEYSTFPWNCHYWAWYWSLTIRKYDQNLNEVH